VVEDNELNGPDHLRQVAPKVAGLHPATGGGLDAEHGAEADQRRAVTSSSSIVGKEEHPEVNELVLERAR